ncbi:MAG TPA: glutamate--tRNA ligase family protein [Phycisphaerales bacterium]|nr:glutamate--tRNA ligase family protein [Phycisphaerales bacterium]
MTAPRSQPETTRLAPSPTGALHLGNARTFLVNWAVARQQGWRIVLRVEDLDTPRIKPGVIDLTIDLLRWLGIDWDAGPLIQSADLAPYHAAMHTLAREGLIYPSDLTRREIETAASAPQEGSHELVFPASLRPATRPRLFTDDASSWRFVTPELNVTYQDSFAGPQSFDPSRTIGDFVVWTRREPDKPGQPSYQLAVVVDDARQGITHIIRGDDLLESAARQLLLYRALGLAPEPTYTHLPLVKGPDGRRLAKRHGDTRLDTYRARGVTPERVVGLIASWCGLPLKETTAAEFRDRLDLRTIPREPVTFLPEHEAWLLGRAR